MSIADATHQILRGRREPEARLLAGCWSLAWSGFDVLLAAMLAGTAWLRRRGDARVGALAGASAAMLVVDAWFDTSTSAKGWDSVTAVVSAVCIELPLAAVCARIAWRAGR